MPDATPLPNDPAARTTAGEIKDQAAIPPTATTTQSPENDPPIENEAPKPIEDPKDGKTLLTADDKKAPEGAPEKYEAFTVPEGFELDETVAKEAGDLFKGLGLSQAQAQSLIDFHVAKTQETAEAPYKAYQDMRKEWRDQVKADPEIGKNLEGVRTKIAKAIDGLGDPKLANDFRAAMDLTGAGDNPAFIRLFNRIADRLSEGTAVTGRGPSPKANLIQRPGSAAQALYPNLPSAASER